MRRRIVLAATACALMSGIAPPSGQAATHTLRFTSRSFTLGGFQVILPKVRVRSPDTSGYVTHMTAILVDGKGRRMSIRHVMLHHLVFLNDGPGVGRAPKGSCSGRHGEPFYGTGEEHQQLVLPGGYGYHVAEDDRWRMQAMLMSHDLHVHRVRVRYTVTYVTGRHLRNVRPFWIRANGCNSEQPSYTVNPTDKNGVALPGGGISIRKYTWTIPFNGRIVAAGGHLHGGALNMTLSQPRCGNRQLLDTKPLYGQPWYVAYRIRPILHEPGPKNTRYFLSGQGIPVVKGEKLTLNGIYDGTHPRARVMAIMHVYVVPDKTVPSGCVPLPSDARELADVNGRTIPPYETLPLSKVSAAGMPYTIPDPPGTLQSYDGNATVDVNGNFTPNIISIPQGATLTWRFSDAIPHNVLFASGPRVAGTPTLDHGATHTTDFTIPGTYRFFCYLHPVTMHQEVIVRPAVAPPAAAVSAPPAPPATRSARTPYAELDVGA